MKKLITYTLAILIVAAAVMAIYRFNFRKSLPIDAPLTEQVAAILQQNDCLVCHDITAANPPFYAAVPMVGDMIRGDMYRAARFTDLTMTIKSLDQINEAELAKLEQSVVSGTMPPLKYKVVHWGTGFNNKEKSVMTQWIAQVRAERFATGLAAPEFANEPIQPIAGNIAVDSLKVALGFKMYNDTRISLDNTVSCADCHVLKDGGADVADNRTSEGINGLFGGVNAPTVYNSVYNHKQFWNGRAATLAEQAAGPPVNPVEMGDQTWEQIAARLSKDRALVKEFAKIYSDGLTPDNVTDAIAEFEKTLTTPDCPFDLYLKGDKGALTPEQIAGYAAFKANDCATCHAGQLMGGQSFEYFGISDDYFANRHADIPFVDDDHGLFGFTNDPVDMHKFKVPTLRNVALTPPYLHDGSSPTMEDAVGKMMRYQIGGDENSPEISSIVTFLRTLTGKNQHLAPEK